MEAAGLSWRRDMNSGVTSERQGLRRPWLLLGPPPHLPPGFSWALAGPIRQYSGACLQPIPPPRASELQPERDRAANRLLGGIALVQGLGKLPLAPLPPPGPHAAPLAFWGPLWCWIPTNLGLLEVSIPCVRWCFPFLLRSRHLPLAGSPLLCRLQILPLSQLPRAVAGGLPLKWTPAAFLEPSLHLHMGDWGQPVSLAQGWWSGAPSLQRSY